MKRNIHLGLHKHIYEININPKKIKEFNNQKNIHTHICVYFYICICVCVCVYIY